MFDEKWTTESTRIFVEKTIETFGVERSMFASNFPVDKIFNSFNVYWNSFKEITKNYSENDLELFIKKSLLKGYTLEKYSPFRTLYLINVIKWHMKLRKIENVKFVISNRSWLNEYSKIAKTFGIELYAVNLIKSPYKILIHFIFRIIKNN